MSGNFNNNQSILIGVTGGIGAGKSIVCKVFSSLGYPVYDADSRAKKLMSLDSDLVAKISSLLGKEAYQNGRLNREFVASKVFNNDDLLRSLNKLVHPAVGRDFKNWVKSYADSPILVKEAALLIEAQSYKELDYLVVVSSPLELRKSRILQRDQHRTSQQIDDIISQQLTEEERVGYADFVITNDENSSLLKQVLELIEDLKKRNRSVSRPV